MPDLSPPTIEDTAVRCAREARSLQTWDHARAALARATELLNEWEKTQPHPHDPVAE